METITNKEVNVRLDNEKGILCLTGLLAGTMVFLYDSQGELKGKHKFALPLLTMEIPQQGTYVLVMSHPNCQPEVRRFLIKHTGILFKWKLLISEYQSVSTSVNGNCFTAVDFLGK